MTVEQAQRQPLPRWHVLSWLASLCVGAGRTTMAEGYALELMTTASSGWTWQA